MPFERIDKGIPFPSYRDYTITVTPLPLTNLDMPREYYWHLYYRGNKVNGGISLSREEAEQRAWSYKNDHHRQMWCASHIWDSESRRWVTDNAVM